MKISLQELLEQKALLERHLSWIKAKIAEAGSGTAGEENRVSPPEEGAAQGEDPPLQAVLPGPSRESERPIPERVGKREGITQGPTPEVAKEAHFGEAFAVGGSHNPAVDTKKGCLLIVAVSILIFTGLLILIYKFYPSWDEGEARQKLQNLQQQD